jgi:hypothetical protein
VTHPDHRAGPCIVALPSRQQYRRDRFIKGRTCYIFASIDVSPEQAPGVQVDVAGNALVAPKTVGATERAWDRRADGEHEGVRRVHGRRGRGRQLRANRVHADFAGAAAVERALDGLLAQVACGTIHGPGSVERERMLAVEGEGRGRRAGGTELVQVEVAEVAAVV